MPPAMSKEQGFLFPLLTEQEMASKTTQANNTIHVSCAWNIDETHVLSPSVAASKNASDSEYLVVCRDELFVRPISCSFTALPSLTSRGFSVQ
ncbi:hypothetical protein Cni_G12901 [Canna indica]|uniref:Uncharacterized protein n=1 Tax=Canna indica TaxID=4628 RepID=A0AAQ3K976_9LILI|nr:hypothetical protein Cni_G12901 [Canna indica]